MRTIHSSEDTSIYEKLVSAFFDEDMLRVKDDHENVGRMKLSQTDTSSIIFTDVDTSNRRSVINIAIEVFRQHCGKHLEILPMRILGNSTQPNRYYSQFFLLLSLISLIFVCMNNFFTCLYLAVLLPVPKLYSRNAVKLLTHGGDMVELCHELRFPFVKWIVAKQVCFTFFSFDVTSSSKCYDSNNMQFKYGRKINHEEMEYCIELKYETRV